MMDDDLDDLFLAARATRLQPSAALMSRILADAAAEQPRAPTEQPRAPAAAARPRLRLSALIAALGGAGGFAALATAAVAGLWIGLAPPAAVDDFAATLLVSAEADSLDLIPDLEGIIDDADG